MSALAGNLSGLASLAGVRLGHGGSDKTVIAMEVMKSRHFIMGFIEKYDLLVPLMAANGWDRASQKLIIDQNLYNEAEKKWVRDVKPPLQAKPTDWEIYNKFSKILSISQDKKTRLVTVAMEHYSPQLAQELVVAFVQEINAVMRERDIADATKSIKYLSYQLERTPVADMRLVFSQLIEEQTKTMMLAEVRDEYVFMTIDPAVVPDRKVKPRKAVICILGTFLGGMLGLLIVLVRYFAQSNVDKINEK